MRWDGKKFEFDHPTLRGLAYRRQETGAIEMARSGKVNLDERGTTGCTALHYAAEKGQPDLARVLVSLGADINAGDCYGDTPLYRAAYSNDTNMAELLLGLGADINARNRSGRTPLFLVQWHKGGGMLKLLLEHGADPNLFGEDGYTVLMEHVAAGITRGVEQLLMHKADPNLFGEKAGETALHLAAKKGWLKITEMLLATGAKQVQNKSGYLPAALAEDSSHPRVAKILREHWQPA